MRTRSTRGSPAASGATPSLLSLPCTSPSSCARATSDSLRAASDDASRVMVRKASSKSAIRADVDACC